METIFALLQQLMVDNLVHSTQDIGLGIKMANELIKLGETCNLKFCKFDSNSFDILKGIPEELWAENAGPSENAEDVEIGGRPSTNEEEFKLDANRVKLLEIVWNHT